jgi:hypothetical protein
LAQLAGWKIKKFRFKNKLVSLDSSLTDLCLSMYDWAKFRTTKGAIKRHLRLDHDGYLPGFGVITTGKVHDVTVAKTQVWTALITMLMLRLMQLKSRWGCSTSILVALLRMNLFTHRELWAWLDNPSAAPPNPTKPE